MLVKGDFILPHVRKYLGLRKFQNCSFLELEQTKHKEVRDQIYKLKQLDDCEVDEGLKCKIIEKINYDKQKHIFPFRNWRHVSPKDKAVV